MLYHGNLYQGNLFTRARCPRCCPVISVLHPSSPPISEVEPVDSALTKGLEVAMASGETKLLGSLCQVHFPSSANSIRPFPIDAIHSIVPIPDDLACCFSCQLIPRAYVTPAACLVDRGSGFLVVAPRVKRFRNKKNAKKKLRTLATRSVACKLREAWLGL